MERSVLEIGQRSVSSSHVLPLTVNIGHGVHVVLHVDQEYETEKLNLLPNLVERNVMRMRPLRVTSNNVQNLVHGLMQEGA